MLHRMLLCGLAVFGGLCWATQPAWAQIEYQFTLVDAFNPDYNLRECYIFDISDLGVACGTATIQIGTSITYTGFYWTPDGGKASVAIGWPRGVSNAGVMAGVQQLYDIPSGQFTTVPMLPGYHLPLPLLDVNDLGLAVGWVQSCNCSNSDGTLQVPYLWDAVNGPRTLPVPGANGAARINNHGLVVGWIGGNVMTNGYVYDLNTGQYTVVSDLFVGANVQTTAVDVTDDGTIVGWRKEQNGQVSHGYTWSPSAGVKLLPLPPPDYQPHVRPSGLNQTGTVVGAIYTPAGSSRAFVYDAAHGIRDLNTLTQATPGFTLMTATAINKHGWVVGYGFGGGGMYRSYVLTPIRPGDLNCDGVVNFGDIDPFVLALSGQAAYESQYPDCRWLNADVNGDGHVDFGDIDPFVALLAGG